MKKILFSLMFALTAMNIMADQLKVVPFSAEANNPNDQYEDFFVITLDNEVDEMYTGFDFTIYLPEGMSIKDDRDGIDFSHDRFGKIVRGNWTSTHAVGAYAQRKDGGIKVSIADPKLTKIHGTSGDLLFVYYQTNADFKGGEIAIKEQLLFPDGDTTIKGDDFEGTVTTAVKVANADEASEKANKFMTKKGLVITKGNKKYNAAAQEIK